MLDQLGPAQIGSIRLGEIATGTPVDRSGNFEGTIVRAVSGGEGGAELFSVLMCMYVFVIMGIVNVPLDYWRGSHHW